MGHDQTTTLESLPRPDTRGTATYFTAPAHDQPKTIADHKGHNKGNPGPGKLRSTKSIRSPFRADTTTHKTFPETKPKERPTEETLTKEGQDQHGPKTKELITKL